MPSSPFLGLACARMPLKLGWRHNGAASALPIRTLLANRAVADLRVGSRKAGGKGWLKDQTNGLRSMHTACSRARKQLRATQRTALHCTISCWHAGTVPSSRALQPQLVLMRNRKTQPNSNPPNHAAP